MSTAVETLESLITDQPANPLRPHQIRAYEEEMQRVDAIVKAPPYMGGDRGHAHKRHRDLSKLLRDQAPKPIEEPMRRDAIAKAAREVFDTVIRPAMLPQEVMRRNPAGAVDLFLKQENSRPVRRAETAWRRAMRALEPENDDRDYTNKERFRPTVTPNGVASFMVDGTIPGAFAMTPAAKANWPLGEPTVETPLAQARAAEKIEKKPRRSLSPEERRIIGERLNAGRRKQREAKASGGISDA